MKRNLFDLDNARYLKKRELVDTFIPTAAFEDILSPKNQIIIGSRGSGKTALLKMISHDHLSLLDYPLAKEIINSRLYIGIHISTKTKFVGGLKNKPWLNDDEKEFHFRWLMNLASSLAFLETIKSCLATYVSDAHERIVTETKIMEKLSELWLPLEDRLYTITDLENALERVRYEKSYEQLYKNIYGDKYETKPIGITFDLELFDPIKIGIRLVSNFLDLQESSWFICIDEIEILEEFHHQILNSYLRSSNENIFFKFTTLPYCHYTLDTNTNAPLEIRHDVHYVYIDQSSEFDYRSTPENDFVLRLFQTRAEISKPIYSNLNFAELFGVSLLLDNFQINYPKGQKHYSLKKLIEDNDILEMFFRLAGEPTLTRGSNFLKEGNFAKFGNQIGRKMKGLLLLKNEYDSLKGNASMKTYSGARTVITVGDSNPRKLLEIFNEMIKKYEESTYFKDHEKNFEIVKQKKVKNKFLIPLYIQNFVLVSVAERELSKSRIEKNIGTGLYDLINEIGGYMHRYIHDKPLTTEQVSSIEINKNIDDITWEVIKRAVQKGLLYPNRNVHNPNEMPYKEGVFHLAFVLSPKFIILPRRGDSRILSNIISKQLELKFDA
tara:strand:+ start:14934 stop:16760 length:1827 start_codon:yes stop_codon:yes gene_type:complete